MSTLDGCARSLLTAPITSPCRGHRIIAMMPAVRSFGAGRQQSTPQGGDTQHPPFRGLSR